MNYIKNDSGDIKVRYANGVEKYLPLAIAQDRQTAKAMKFEPVEAPTVFEPPIINVEQVEAPTVSEAPIMKTVEQVEAPTVLTEKSEPAKRGRKPNK